MSFREEDREKDNCSSRGLGLGLAAAAAIGVGVGAALYYFINKRTETPTAEGSTSQNWTCESPQTLFVHEESLYNSDDSYTTFSEHSTTDTSIFEDIFCKCIHNNNSENDISDEEFSDSENQYTQSSTEISISTSDNENSTDTDEESNDDRMDTFTSSNESDPELSEWDVTTSLEYPSFDPVTIRERVRSYTRNLIMSQQKDKRHNELNSRRDEAFRERSWSLEECSICFDVILRDQEIMSLPCTHNFHTKCILPWLQEQQTCPNCRKSID